MGTQLNLPQETTFAPTKPMATWRVPSQISELVEHSPYETIYLRAFAWVMLLFAMGYDFIIARRWEVDLPALTSDIQVFTVVIVCQLCLVFLYTRLSNKIDLGPGLRRLRTKIPGEAAVPVLVDIIQADVVTGSDEGFIWIESGTLYFKGLQTVFRLNSVDVSPLGDWPRKIRPSIDRGIPPRYILFRYQNGTVQVRLKMIDPFMDHATRRKSHLFERGLVKWLAERPEGSLESLLPPLDLHDSLRHTSPFRLEGFFGGLLMVGIGALILLTARHGHNGLGLMPIVYATELSAGLIVSVLGARFALSQWRDIKVRNRLAANLPQPLEKNFQDH